MPLPWNWVTRLLLWREGVCCPPFIFLATIPHTVSQEKWILKTARFSPQLLSQFPEVFSIAGTAPQIQLCSLLPELWPVQTPPIRHTPLTLLSCGQSLLGVRQVEPPFQASGRARLPHKRANLRETGLLSSFHPLKAVNHFPDADYFTCLFFFLCSTEKMEELESARDYLKGGRKTSHHPASCWCLKFQHLSVCLFGILLLFFNVKRE